MNKITLDKHETTLMLVIKGHKISKQNIEVIKNFKKIIFNKPNNILNEYKELAYEHHLYAGITLKGVTLKDIVIFRMLPLAEKIFAIKDFSKILIDLTTLSMTNNNYSALENLFLALYSAIENTPIKINNEEIFEFDTSLIETNF